MIFKVYYVKTMRYGVSKKIRNGAIAALVLSCVVVASGLSIYFLHPWERSSKSRNWLTTFESDAEMGIYSSAAVSTDSAPCAAVGRKILDSNGNAADAAIATLLCMGVTIPHSMGIGGGCLIAYYKKNDRTARTLNAREMAPLAASIDMFKGNKSLAQIGGLAVGVPGEIMGYSELHRLFPGRLEWKDLFQPSIDLCREGFPVSRHLAKALHENRKIIFEEPSLSSIFVNNVTGDVYKEGEILKRPDLAETLAAIGANGADEIYGGGAIGKKLVEDIKNFGGIITDNDMLTYTAKSESTVSVKLRNNLTVHSTGIPGSGAILELMLNIMNGYDLNEEIGSNLSATVLMYHRLIETFKFAYARRMELGDFDGVNELEASLTSIEQANVIRSKIIDNQTFDDPEHYGVQYYLDEDQGTAHVSVVDAEGNAVSVGSTVNAYLGSKRISTTTGILLNNQMDDFSSPNITNLYDVPPGKANHAIPERRPLSSMSPAIIVNETDGNVVMVIGGSGGTKITTAVASVIMRSLWLGQTIKEAIDAHRIHHQLFPNVATYETGFPEEIVEGLRVLGHKIELLTGRTSIIMAILRGEDGRLYANSDYRKGGKTDGF